MHHRLMSTLRFPELWQCLNTSDLDVGCLSLMPNMRWLDLSALESR